MVSCKKVLSELSNYMADGVAPALKQEIEHHLAHCVRCSVLLDSTRKMLLISGDERTFEVPVGHSERLHRYSAEKLGG